MSSTRKVQGSGSVLRVGVSYCHGHGESEGSGRRVRARDVYSYCDSFLMMLLEG